MTIIHRNFGVPPSKVQLMELTKPFVDIALETDVQTVIDASKRMNRIGSSVAKICGVTLQREGDSFAKTITAATYTDMYAIMQPSLTDEGHERTRQLMTSDTTHDTLVRISATSGSYDFSTMAHAYAKNGRYFKMTKDGLVENPDDNLLTSVNDTIGCPYAMTEKTTYFNKFSDHIVNTYCTAESQNMPRTAVQAFFR